MFLKTLFALTLAAAAMGNSEKPSASSKKKPSFVFSMTDDQDKLLDSMQALPLTKKKIGL